MTIAIFETYVIDAGLGDPLPRIGSGMRIVEVKIGRKWVRIRAPNGRITRLSLKRWVSDVPHVRYQGDESQAEVNTALNKWRR